MLGISKTQHTMEGDTIIIIKMSKNVDFGKNQLCDFVLEIQHLMLITDNGIYILCSLLNHSITLLSIVGSALGRLHRLAAKQAHVTRE